MTTTKELTSIYQGSIYTLADVASQINSRFGSDAVKQYDPTANCFTYTRWQQEGYQVRKGEKALKSITWIKDEKTGNKYPRTVNLFYISQVDKIEEKKSHAQEMAEHRESESINNIARAANYEQ